MGVVSECQDETRDRGGLVVSFPWAEVAVGAGAGLIVGAFARRAARQAIAGELIVGDKELAERMREGVETVAREAPTRVRAAIRQGVTDGLDGAGLTRAEARELVGYVQTFRRFLGRVS